MFEWRLRPERLDRELVKFLDEVWGSQRAAGVTFWPEQQPPGRP